MKSYWAGRKHRKEETEKGHPCSHLLAPCFLGHRFLSLPSPVMKPSPPKTTMSLRRRVPIMNVLLNGPVKPIDCNSISVDPTEYLGISTGGQCGSLNFFLHLHTFFMYFHTFSQRIKFILNKI